MVAAWSVGDAALNTQLNSLVSEFFGDCAEAGFASFNMWQALASGVAFVLPLVGVRLVLYAQVVAACCASGALCLGALEFVAGRRNGRRKGRK